MPQDTPLAQVERQFLDLNTVPRLKEPRDPARNMITKEQVQAAQSVNQLLPASTSTIPLQASPSPQGEALSPAQPPSKPAITFPAPAPVLPTDSSRAADRINKLYGQRMSAEDRAIEAERRLADYMARLDARFSGATPAPAPTNGFSPNGFNAPEGPAPSDGNYITRSEMARLLQEHTQTIMRQNALTEAHRVSRVEAERDFPDVFAHPEAQLMASRIWNEDRLLQQDPQGPYKAAMMARGATVERLTTTSSGTPTAVQKAAISAIGASVAEGQPPPADDRNTRYTQALARARDSGSEADANYALAILRGLA